MHASRAQEWVGVAPVVGLLMVQQLSFIESDMGSRIRAPTKCSL